MRLSAVASFLGLVSSIALAQQADIPLTNWTVPPYHGRASTQGGLATMTDVTPGVGFVGVTPCRLVDTRQAGFPATYGTPALTAGAARNFDLNSDPLCTGIPAGVEAYSLNVTVTNPQGAGFILIYPQGGAQPSVSTLNYVAGETIANAAIVPAGTNGGVTVVAGGAGTNLIIDINGYFTDEYNMNGGFRVYTTSQWGIIGETSSSNNLATGVLGQATATTGVNIGVWGETFSSGDGARGVMGFVQTNTGKTYGVQGLTNSTTVGAAGVKGIDGHGEPPGGTFASAGVRGASRLANGVHGVSQFQGVEGTRVDAIGTYQSAGILGYSGDVGVFAYGQVGATGTKPFIEPHPTDPTKEIAYVALEGPEAGTYFRGRERIRNGTGIIEVPESFRLVSDEEGLTVYITPIGKVADVAVLSADLNTITVRSSVSDLEFYYVVQGVRKAFRDWQVIRENEVYVPRGPDSKMPTAFSPEQRRRLIATGIYNGDGTVNMETARRLEWDKEWEKRKAPAPQTAPEK
jgi:hypothetical protein